MAELTKDTIKAGVKFFDDLIKLKGISEVADGIILKIAFNFINAKAVKKLPDEFVGLLDKVLGALFVKDFPVFKDELTVLIKSLIKSEYIDGEMIYAIIDPLVDELEKLFKE